ncbi:hypothetical protein BJV77DRAFT_102655 [Russula vinacea]|nr:hypothetical protein BJV77DRAFT_102655 [Russula vinacea]
MVAGMPWLEKPGQLILILGWGCRAVWVHNLLGHLTIEWATRGAAPVQCELPTGWEVTELVSRKALDLVKREGS